MFRRLFLDHPESVGESFGAHFRVASSFGLRMIWGGLRCAAHAWLPFAWQTAGSDTVASLHREMLAKRAAKSADLTQMATVEYVI